VPCRTALIIGIACQDGWYLAEHLLSKGYLVHGLIRRSSYQDPHESDARLRLHYGDLSDCYRIAALLEFIQPGEVHHLAAQSTGMGADRLLEAIRVTALHESPHRGEHFVTRDWGYASEYVDAMWRTLQRDEPGDYVVATGTSYSVRGFLRFCFEHTDLDWEGNIRFDERHLRPSKAAAPVGDASKAAQEPGWRAAVHTPELARTTVDAELTAVLAPVHERSLMGA
jgi:GDP-D-mannose dehydratase